MLRAAADFPASVIPISCLTAARPRFFDSQSTRAQTFDRRELLDLFLTCLISTQMANQRPLLPHTTLLLPVLLLTRCSHALRSGTDLSRVRSRALGREPLIGQGHMAKMKLSELSDMNFVILLYVRNACA